MTLSAAVGNFNTGTGAATTTVVVSGLGFQPKVVFLWWSGRTETTDTAGRLDHKRGFGCAISTTDRRSLASLSQDTPTTMVTNHSQDDTECVYITTTADAIDGKLDVQSIDSGGFTLVVDDQFTADYRVHYLAVGGTDLTNAEGGSFSKSTSAGDQDVTSVSFQPDCVLLFSSGQSTMNSTVEGDSPHMISAFTSSAQAVIVAGANDAVGTAVTKSYCTDAECAAFLATESHVNGRSCDVRIIFVQRVPHQLGRKQWSDKAYQLRRAQGSELQGRKPPDPDGYLHANRRQRIWLLAGSRHVLFTRTDGVHIGHGSGR